jgi:hypothetical protein
MTATEGLALSPHVVQKRKRERERKKKRKEYFKEKKRIGACFNQSAVAVVHRMRPFISVNYRQLRDAFFSFSRTFPQTGHAIFENLHHGPV